MHPAIVYVSSKKLKLTRTAETYAYESYVHGTVMLFRFQKERVRTKEWTAYDRLWPIYWHQKGGPGDGTDEGTQK